MATPTLFTGILGVLVVMAIVLFVIAQSIVEPDPKYDDPLVSAAIQERIAPVGRIRTTDDPAAAVPVSTQAASSAGATPESGQATYEAVCHVCHTTGVLNAPKLGDKQVWAERIKKGKEVLYANSINGLNQMPAKGGRPDYSDEQIRKAVDYMLEEL